MSSIEGVPVCLSVEQSVFEVILNGPENCQIARGMKLMKKNPLFYSSFSYPISSTISSFSWTISSTISSPTPKFKDPFFKSGKFHAQVTK